MTLYDPVVVTVLSSTISESGLVIIRLVKPVPAAENTPDVSPAPNINSLLNEVVTDPVVAVAALPDVEANLSKGFVVSKPLYSLARKSTKAAGVLKVTVTIVAFAAAATIFLA